MRYLFTVCGRAGSKGIRGKNCGDFLGVPLVYYTLAVVRMFEAAHPEDSVVLALNTDSEDLRSLVEASGVGFEPVERDAELAGDAVGKVDVIRATYADVVARGLGPFDCVVDLDITSPLRRLSDLEALLAKRAMCDAGVVFTVAPARRNPWFNMVRELPGGGCTKVIDSDYTARQQAPAVYDMNASMYAYSAPFMEGEGQIFDWPCDFTVMQDTAVLDLDNPWDLELMEAVAGYLFEADDELRAVRDEAASLAAVQEASGAGKGFS